MGRRVGTVVGKFVMILFGEPPLLIAGLDPPPSPGAKGRRPDGIRCEGMALLERPIQVA
jgi:hypothetical protein